VGLSITFSGAPDGGDGPFTLATASGWAAFAAWAGTLPDGESAALRRLCDAGEVAGTDALSRELSAALTRHPPDSEAVRHTATDLLASVGVGDPAESAAVTDGDAPARGPGGGGEG
jgi:hypothetical protein